MAAFDLVAIVGSLGGPEAVRHIVSALPPYFPAAVLVVQHRAPAAEQLTADLLGRCARLEVGLARPGDVLEPAHVYVAPVSPQLLVGADLDLVPGTPASWPKPLVADPLFASAAERLGPRVLAVVLSGMNADGASGAAAVKRHGGRVLAQDRGTARAFTMPASAIATGCVDFVLPLQRLPQAIIALTMTPGAADLLQVPLPPWARLAS